MGRRVLRRHAWGYSICLCPIKGTTGLNELMLNGFAHHYNHFVEPTFIFRDIRSDYKDLFHLSLKSLNVFELPAFIVNSLTVTDISQIHVFYLNTSWWYALDKP